MTRRTQREAVLHARNTFALAYVHADDSRIMRRDSDDVADSYAPTRRLVEGRG